MTILHVYFALRNQQAFQRSLEGAPAHHTGTTSGSGSGGRSWKGPSPLSIAASAPVDLNARDALGRTVLHLACAATDAAAIEYVRMLLAHPTINVNLQDVESQWTGLHHALYNGNLAAALLLLQHVNTDVTITDCEGHSAFDLYNTTVADTRPHIVPGKSRFELLTWGANRNAALGHSDGDDRTYPDQVTLRRSDKAGGNASFKKTLAFRLKPASVVDVQMSRLHTVVVTNEPQNNIRACGFASTGRLGPGGGLHTQHAFAPVQGVEHTIFAVALGQDHTLALTDAGVILSWGLNRFAQLGYTVEGARGEDHVQAVPRAILGLLKKERVAGVAACKTASVCWTDKTVFTWGKNNGQLGYDKTAHPVQPVPRIVTAVTKPVITIAVTDTAMACLLESRDVILLFNDGYIRVNFPTDMLTPSGFLAYRPPHAVQNTKIAKLICNDTLFAAISSAGEMFTFAPPSASTPTPEGGGSRGSVVRPQRVWALRKHWEAVVDAALGADGSLIVCTAAGHVLVRSRGIKGALGTKAFKFARVPYIQRAVAVRANDTGALSALRVDFRPAPIEIVGNKFAEDLMRIRPYLDFKPVLPAETRIEPRLPLRSDVPASVGNSSLVTDDDEMAESDDLSVAEDIAQLTRLWDVFAQDKLSRKRYGGVGLYARPGAHPLAHGADVMIRVQSAFEFPAHRFVLAARCLALADILGKKSNGLHDRASGISVKFAPAAGVARSRDPRALPRLAFTGCHPLAVLALVHYLYSDETLALGDARIVRAVQPLLAPAKLQLAQIARELAGLGGALQLPAVVEATQWASKRTFKPTMYSQMAALFREPSALSGALKPDVVLRLSDREVCCHSVILRARTEFFACFFDEEVWTSDRWDDRGVLTVDLRHLDSKFMDYVLRFMCLGDELEMFDRLDFIESADQLLDLLFGVMSAANELLLDRLLLVCASVMLQYLNTHNVCAVFSEAADLHCEPLMDRVQTYMAVNLETLLESRMLDDLTPRLIKQLTGFLRQQQMQKMPYTRSPTAMDALMEKHRAWVESEDFPVPFVRTTASKGSPRLSPKASRSRKVSLPGSPMSSPSFRPNLPPMAMAAPSGDELFTMDDVPALNLDGPASDATSSAGRGGSPWKPRTTAPRFDMKTILAEAEAGQTQRMSSAVYRPPSKDALRPAFVAQGDSSEERSTRRAFPGTPPARPSPVTTPHVLPSPTTHPVQTTPQINRAPSSAALGVGTPPRPLGLEPRRPSAPTLPGLGPTITPSKQFHSPGPSTTRNTSGGKAWTLPPVEPVVQASSPGAALSFAEIQRLQHEQGAVPVKDRRSLKEIQDEEQQRQQEDDFLKWWAAEEERVRLEAEAMARPPPKRERGTGGKRPKGAAKKTPAGHHKGGAVADSNAQPDRARQRTGTGKAPLNAKSVVSA